MAYIDRADLIGAIVEYEKQLLINDEKYAAQIAHECRKIVIDQKVITAIWNNDTCSQCGRKTEGAMGHRYEWCPWCGAEMLNEWTDEDEDGDDE